MAGHGRQRGRATSARQLDLAEEVGKQVTHPTGVKSKYCTVTATFNGAVFEAKGDGTVLFSAPAQSGRPYTVSKADAAKCKGSPDASYMNNPPLGDQAQNLDLTCGHPVEGQAARVQQLPQT